MAGIGFRLQNLLKNDSFISRIKAYTYSAIISSGPWIYSLLSFVVISFFVTADIRMHKIFQVTVIYVFAFSQILAGIIQLVATRIISDYIYSGEFSMISTVYLNCIMALSPLLFVFGAVVFGTAGLGVAYTAISTILFVLMGLVWTQLIILTACRDFHAITYRFGVGFAISVAFSIAFGTFFGFIFYFLGFTLGILYIFLSMHDEILNEFGAGEKTLSLFRESAKFRKYGSLFAVGFFFNLGIWVDKLLFWSGGGGRNVCGLLYENSVYDRLNLIMVAMLIPVMALFTLKVETNFYVRFRNFYKSIVEKENLDSINMNLELMKKSIKSGAVSVLRIVLPLAFVIIVFSDVLMDGLKLSAEFRTNWAVYTCGSAVHSFLMLSLIMLMYFDFLDDTLRVTMVFFALNLLSNAAGIYFFGQGFMGFGYAFSVTAALAMSVYLLKKRIDNLLYYTFERERIAGEIIVEAAPEPVDGGRPR